MAQLPLSLFSTEVSSTEASKHAVKHYGDPNEPKIFETEFMPTNIEELEFIRSPFYDLGKYSQLKEGPEAQHFLTNVSAKLNMLNDSMQYLSTPHETPDSVAFTRYADQTVQ
jgi:hypothetical protein